MNYLQQFAGLCAENFSWNVWIDTACSRKLVLLYGPDKETKKHLEWLGNMEIRSVKTNPLTIRSGFLAFYWMIEHVSGYIICLFSL